MKITPAWKKGSDGKEIRVYLIRYQDKSKLNASGKPVHRQESFDKRKQAEARLLVLQNEMAEGFHIAKRDVKTFEEAANEYLQHVEDKHKDGRILGVRRRILFQTLGKIAIPFMGQRKLNDLTAGDIEELYRHLIRTKGMKPMSASKYINDVKLALDYAVKRKWVKGNVAVDARSELRDIKAMKIAQFTPDDVKHLLKVAIVRPKNAAYRAQLLLNIFVNAAAFCGLRWGEIAGLQPENINFDACLIHVRHSLSPTDGLKDPKTRAGIRDVPMPAHLRDMFQEWMAKYLVRNKLGLVLSGRIENGKICSGGFHTNLWHPLLKRAGLYGRKLHFHALRHFAASWWLANGVPVTDVAKMLGHSKVDMTMSIYAHALSKTSVAQSAIERMSGALLTAPATATRMPPTSSIASRLRPTTQPVVIAH